MKYLIYIISDDIKLSELDIEKTINNLNKESVFM